MSSPWDPAISQAMQRHGGSNRSIPKTMQPKPSPNEAPNDPAVGNPPRRDDLVHDDLDAPVTPERQAG